jgi:hypothetical protein
MNIHVLFIPPDLRTFLVNPVDTISSMVLQSRAVAF